MLMNVLADTKRIYEEECQKYCNRGTSKVGMFLFRTDYRNEVLEIAFGRKKRVRTECEMRLLRRRKEESRTEAEFIAARITGIESMV